MPKQARLICTQCGHIGTRCPQGHGYGVEIDAAARILGLTRSTFRQRILRHWQVPADHPKRWPWEKITAKMIYSGIAAKCREAGVSETSVRKRIKRGATIAEAIEAVRAARAPDQSTFAAVARRHGIDESTFRKRYQRHLGRGLSRKAALEAAIDSDVQRVLRRTDLTPAEVFTRCL